MRTFDQFTEFGIYVLLSLLLEKPEMAERQVQCEPSPTIKSNILRSISTLLSINSELQLSAIRKTPSLINFALL